MCVADTYVTPVLSSAVQIPRQEVSTRPPFARTRSAHSFLLPPERARATGSNTPVTMESSLTESQRNALRVEGFGPTAVHFVKNNGGWMFNLVMAHLLFWLFGFTALLEYGYSDLNQSSSGQIVSGPSGSGVGIITTLLMAVATLVVIVKAVRKQTPRVAHKPALSICVVMR
ncbi:unnamed protein product [Scytosiphon promiscuus]